MFLNIWLLLEVELRDVGETLKKGKANAIEFTDPVCQANPDGHWRQIEAEALVRSTHESKKTLSVPSCFLVLDQAFCLNLILRGLNTQPF